MSQMNGSTVHKGAQLSYINFSTSDIEIWKKNNGEESLPTIQDILRMRYSNDENILNLYYNHSSSQGIINKGVLEEILSDQDTNNQKQIDEIVDSFEEKFVYSLFDGSSSCANWILSDVKDLNDQNGFFAATFITGEHIDEDGNIKYDILISFRGSESTNNNGVDIGQLLQDWIIADGSLLKDELNSQGLSAKEYLKEAIDNPLYDNITITGHSLGGNLAFTAAVCNANDDNIYKLKGGYSFDGPGNTEDFLVNYHNEIEIVKDKLHHYYYTAVGCIFNQYANEDIEIETKNNGNGSPMNGYHSLSNVYICNNEVKRVDENASQNSIGKAINAVTKYIDHNEIIEESLIRGLLDATIGMADVGIYCEKVTKSLEDNTLSDSERVQLGYELQKILVQDRFVFSDCVPAIMGDKTSKLLVNSVELMGSLYETILLFASGNNRKAIVNITKTIGGMLVEQGVPIVPIPCPINSIVEKAGECAGEQVGEKIGEWYCDLFNIKDSGNSILSGFNQINGIANSVLTNMVAITGSYAGLVGSFSNYYINSLQACCGNATNQAAILSINYSSINNQLTKFINEIMDLSSSFEISINGTIDGILAKIPIVGGILNEEHNINPLFILQYFVNHMQEESKKNSVFNVISDIVEQKITVNNEILRKSGLQGKYLFRRGTLQHNTFEENDFNERDYYRRIIINELEKIEKSYILSGQAVRYNPDPLVLDLDSDGISLLAKKLGVYFDEDSNGLKEKTQWIDAEDALLSIDLNNNGIIDGGEELFGTSTVLSDGSLARTGFEALAQYDSNEDGVIDEQDDVFDRLLVWRDSNVDGVTDEGELETLRHHGIERISLADGEGDEGERRTTLVQYSDGHTANLSEVDFEADYYDVREKEEIEISDSIKELPNVQAIGDIPSLHTLMQLDETGELQEMVEAFMTAETVDEREEICTAIIEKITGADKVVDGSRGTEFEAKKLAVIEAFMGREFIGTAGSNPVNTAATILSGVYDKLYNLYYGMLAKESVLKPYLSLIYLFEGEDGERYVDTTYFDVISKLAIESDIDMKNIVPEMARFINMMNPDSTENVTDFVNQYVDYAGYIEEFSKCRLGITLGTSEADEISGTGEADTIISGKGDDILRGNNGADALYGNSGDDTLYGENGNDILNGGTGSDHMDGGYGSDTYVFNLGDGVDTVFDYEYDTTPQDKILFGEGISASDVRMERRGNNLVVWYSENDSFTVQDAYRDYYGTGRYFVESVEFSDGTIWNTEEIANRANKILGTDGDDALAGFGEAVGYHQDETFHAGAGNDQVNAANGNDIIYGEDGNDTLYGENGNDILNGGVGEDHLDGGYGSDTYVFNLGDGVDTVFDYEYDMTPQDRILFGSGISDSDVRMERRGNNLVVWYSENDSFTIQDAYRDYYGTGRYFVESVEFSDGTVWDTEEIANRANKILGTDEDDTLVGFSEAVGYHQDEAFHIGAGNDKVNAGNGNDIIFGEEGNDTLYGENGNDILNGGIGLDHMDGGYGSDTYVFNLGDGVDTVFDYEYDMAPQDKIFFGKEIKVSDVRMERRGNDLVVWYSENDSFTVQDAYRDYYGTGRYFVESVEFSDGTIWDTEEIANRANRILGTDGDDTLVGFGEAVGYHQDETFHAGAGNDKVNAADGNDIIYGEAGNDTLYGENGNDTLIGGTDSDHMDGGYGSDTYVFNLGDGVDTVFDYEYDTTPQDKILFGEGITAEDVRMERRGNNLVVWYSENDSFTVQDAYRDYYGTGRYFVESVKFSDGTVWNTEEIANRANKILGTDEDDALIGFGEAVGYHQDETFHAGAGSDQVNAGNGNDILFGEAGNDTLYGENGNDILNGGTGSDHMDGGYGSDTYVFNLGDGVDTVFDYEYDMTPQDRILFGEGISASDVRMERRANNLVIWYSENDSLTVQDAYRDYYGTGRYFVESVEFADGTTWDTEEIANRANKILGTDGDDALVGFGEAVGYHQDETFHAGSGSDQVNAGNGNDILFGEAGNDTLYGENGNDILNGGTGSDHMDGGYGSDTYVFNLGDGVDTVFDYEYDTTPQDKILFGEGITATDVRMERRGNNLVVWYSENDSFTVQDAYRDYYGTGRYFVESVEFSDGTVWNTEEIANRANKILGTDGDDELGGFGEAVGYHQDETFHTGTGNDTVNAGNGNDILYGEAGNDTLYGENGDDTLIGGTGYDHMDGGYGSDTYVFNLGDGVDTVFDYEYDMTPQDRILFGEGINVADVRMERRGNNLVVWYSENDSFTVQDAYRDYYGTGRYFVESVEFSDGTVWNTEEIANRANKILGTDGDDSLTGFGEAIGYHQDETFHAGAGNDKVNAADGNDNIYGEDGNDTLYGENGNDTLNGGTGSDHMDGGCGSDTYIFNLGDGVDTVFDYEYDMTPQDRILFGEGISSSDVRMERRDNNLVVWYSENDSFTVQDAYRDYYGTGRYFVESVEFEDGTVWNTEGIASRANKILGTDKDDSLVGFDEAVGYHQDETFHAGAGNDRVNAGNGNDALFGESGNDTLYGENGNDTLNGGTGNDYLDGGSGADTYIFNLGDGKDTIFDYEYDMTPQDKIVFGKGISLNDISLERDGLNLTVKYSENDQVTIDSAYRDYYGIGKYQIEQVEFEDGTKTIIDYDKESLVVTYQPEPVEEPVQTETEETPVSEETVDQPVQEEIVTEEISLSEDDLAVETEEVFELDEVVAVVEEVLNTDIVETDQEFELSEESDAPIVDYIDTEMEQATNLLVQEMSAPIEGNVSEHLTEEQLVLTTDELLWTE